MSFLEPLVEARLSDGPASSARDDRVVAARIMLDAVPARELSLSFAVPRNDLAASSIIRKLTSEANNLVAIYGGQRLHICCPPCLVPRDVLNSLRARYRQVWGLLDGPSLVTASHLDAEWKPRAAVASPRAVATKGAFGGTAVGVNIGQTDTKVIVVGPTRPAVRWSESTFPLGVRRGYGLGSRLVAAVERAVADGGPAIQAVGISVGGIVRNGIIARNAGVTLGLNDADYESFITACATISQRYGVDVAVSQDVEAKAFFHAVDGRRSCLVLDLGTSLGGAYIDETGALPGYLNQVGRLAFDLDDEAVPRPDGLGDGLLSQYVSARGFSLLAAAVGIHLEHAADIESVVVRPETLASRRFLTLLERRVVAGVGLAADKYEAQSVLLTGGLLRGALGPVVKGWLQASGRFQTEVSADPVFDGCIGAAWVALAQFVDGP